MKPHFGPISLYKAVRTNKWGIHFDKGPYLISGLRLALVDPWSKSNPDILENELSEVGDEASIVMPEEGLVGGNLYHVELVVTSTDWETGFADEWDLHIKPLRTVEVDRAIEALQIRRKIHDIQPDFNLPIEEFHSYIEQMWQRVCELERRKETDDHV